MYLKTLSPRNLFSFGNNRSMSTIKDVLKLEKCTGTHHGIVTLGINRPEVKNALTLKMFRSLSKTLRELKWDEDVRVFIIHSLAKNVFCSGADLRENAALSGRELENFVSEYRQLVIDMHNCAVPTIAAIDGYALGGGFELALGCDLRVISHSAKIGLVETKLAFIPGCGGTQLATRLVRPAKAKEIIYTSRIFDGIEALEIGLVNHVVEQNKDGDAAFRQSLILAEEISQQGPTNLRQIKLELNKSIDINLTGE